VKRWLAGRFAPGHWAAERRLGRALEPDRSHLLRVGPVEVAYTGPEIDEHGEVLCLLDGRLDNAAELREALGEPFRPEDSEERLLGRAYRRWGSGLPGRMRGDFVLFAWDRRGGHGLLARDQLGARPAFLHGVPDGVLRFAGEVRHLLALLPSRPEPDPASLAHWIAASTRPGLQTLYAGIRRLGPGGALLLAEDGGREARYWAPSFRGTLDLPPAELAASVRGSLDRAVGRRAGEPAAVLMSGGLDSSAIAALGAAAGRPPIVCSAGFPDHPATDESALIEELRARLSLSGPSATVRPGGLLRSMLAHLERWEMPQLGWGDFWAERLIEAAAGEGAAVVLGGDGGDEVFGPRSYLLADRLRGGRPLAALALARSLPGAGPHLGRREVLGVYRRLAIAGALPAARWRPPSSLRARSEAPGWMLPAARRALAESERPNAWKRLDGPRWWSHAAYGIAEGIEQNGVFEHQQRRAAPLGVEAAHPMLDLDLVELCLSLPPEASLDPRFNRPLLRAATAGALPDAVRLRPAKAWFESLIVDCLRADADLVRRLLTEPGAELGAYADLRAIRAALFEREEAWREDPFSWMWQVWRLLTAECWLRAQTRSVSQILPPDAVPSEARVEIAPGVDSYLFHP
jgi:asparagine synthase (glutamine-hydrolysing)